MANTKQIKRKQSCDVNAYLNLLNTRWECHTCLPTLCAHQCYYANQIRKKESVSMRVCVLAELLPERKQKLSVSTGEALIRKRDFFFLPDFVCVRVCRKCSVHSRSRWAVDLSSLSFPQPSVAYTRKNMHAHTRSDHMTATTCFFTGYQTIICQHYGYKKKCDSNVWMWVYVSLCICVGWLLSCSPSQKVRLTRRRSRTFWFPARVLT